MRATAVLILCLGLPAVLPCLTAAQAEEAGGASGGRLERVLVLDRRPGGPSRGALDGRGRRAGEPGMGVHRGRAFSHLPDVRVLEVEQGGDAGALIKQLKATGRYAAVEPDHAVHAALVPGDPRYADGSQWNLDNTGAGGGAADADIDAPEGWDLCSDASAVVVATLDTGVRLTHEDIAPNLWTNTGEIAGNGVDDDHDGYVDDVHGINAITGTGSPADDNGHGSHVAGIIGARGNNGLGIAGVAWRVTLMPLKFLSSSGSGSISDSIECINYAIAHGARVINASYCSTEKSAVEQAAIESARDAGIIVVAAAGNDGLSVDMTPCYPAAHAVDNIVAVASSTDLDVLASSSNTGSGAVELAAPGESILSCSRATDSSYVTKSGTSMASPHVAGIAALLCARFPAEDYRQIINRLLRGADAGAGFAGRVLTGGRASLWGALSTTTSRPFNDDFSGRALVAGEILHVRTSNAHATLEAAEASPWGAAAGASLWFGWTAPAPGTVAIDTLGSGYDTLLAVYTGDAMDGLALVASNDNSGGATTSSLTFTATAGESYCIVVAGRGGATGLTLLNLAQVPANDAFASSLAVEGPSWTLTSNNGNATGETGDPSPFTYTEGKTLWFSWTSPATRHMSVTASSFTIDPVVAVYKGSSLLALSFVGSSDDFSKNSGLDACVTFDAAAGQTYRIMVDTTNTTPDGGDFRLSLLDSSWDAFPGGSVTSAPAVTPGGTSLHVGTTIFDSTGTGYFSAYNGSGVCLWQASVTNGFDLNAAAIAADGTVTVGARDGYLHVYKSSGSTLRTVSVGDIVSSGVALSSAGTAYFRTGGGYLKAVSSSGVQLWSAVVGPESYAGPSLGRDGTVYTGTDGGGLVALASSNGSVKWNCGADSDVYATPAIADDGAVVSASFDGRVLAADGSTGVLRWSCETGTSISGSPATGPDGTVYIAGYDGLLRALNGATGTLKWTCGIGAEVRAAGPLVDEDGNIYQPAYDCCVHMVDRHGRLIRRFAGVDWIRSSPALANGFLSFGDNAGWVHSIPVGRSPAQSSWPMSGQNAARTGRVDADASWRIAASPDLDGDGCDDLVWRRASDGDQAIWLMTGTVLKSASSFLDNQPAWRIAGTGDFDGDGRDDLLWRDNGTGAAALWLMNGGTVKSGTTLIGGGSDWIPEFVGDFDGDGRSDILWRRDGTGSVVLWCFNGLQVAASATLADAGGGWRPDAVKDFNGDGRADILWSDDASGRYAVWLMNGCSVTGGGTIYDSGTGWRVVAAGDLNGDGRGDLIFRRVSDGAPALWMMNGAAVAASSALYSPGLEWDIVAVDDLDGNGRDDLVWYDRSNFETVAWWMNGGTVVNARSLAARGSEWYVQRVASPAATGGDALLWRSHKTGKVGMWVLNGTAIGASATLY